MRVTEPTEARTLLAWLEGLAGCNSQEDLARRAKLDSRTLRRFAAGQGGRRTAARLAAPAGIPLWMVDEMMLPTIGVVDLVWRCRAAGRDGTFLEARGRALELASRAGLLVLLSSCGREEHDLTHLHPADARVLIRWLESLGGWSKEELARKAGLTRQMLWHYAKGDIAMSRHVLRRLAEAAGLPLWLVEGVMLRTITAVRLATEHPHPDQLLAGWRRSLAADFACPGRPISPRP